ncbi:MAG TPA: alpha-amylase family glycosyl hydrolase, partial [Cellulomonas sp.]
FDLLTAPWDAEAFTRVIRSNFDVAAESASTSTWVLSNHDVVRHTTRYAGDQSGAVDLAAGAGGDLDPARGLARARAAALLVAALPGSLYVYQGEELGLPEVTGLPADAAEDPWARVEDGVVVAGRDGCRVPLPWTSRAPYFGFSDSASHLPQPEWFASCSVEAQSHDPASTLALYRAALLARRTLQTVERATWLDLGPGTVAFARPNGWVSITNFGPDPLVLPDGEIVLRSDAADPGDPLAADSTAWLIVPGA